jgi:hypothetical protein
MVTMCVSMRALTIYHPRLIKFLINNFTSQMGNFNDWSQVCTIATIFSLMRINSPAFWKSVCQWMNDHLG